MKLAELVELGCRHCVLLQHGRQGLSAHSCKKYITAVSWAHKIFSANKLLPPTTWKFGRFAPHKGFLGLHTQRTLSQCARVGTTHGDTCTDTHLWHHRCFLRGSCQQPASRCQTASLHEIRPLQH